MALWVGAGISKNSTWGLWSGCIFHSHREGQNCSEAEKSWSSCAWHLGKRNCLGFWKPPRFWQGWAAFLILGSKGCKEPGWRGSVVVALINYVYICRLWEHQPLTSSKGKSKFIQEEVMNYTPWILSGWNLELSKFTHTCFFFSSFSEVIIEKRLMKGYKCFSWDTARKVLGAGQTVFLSRVRGKRSSGYSKAACWGHGPAV